MTQASGQLTVSAGPFWWPPPSPTLQGNPSDSVPCLHHLLRPAFSSKAHKRGGKDQQELPPPSSGQEAVPEGAADGQLFHGRAISGPLLCPLGHLPKPCDLFQGFPAGPKISGGGWGWGSVEGRKRSHTLCVSEALQLGWKLIEGEK